MSERISHTEPHEHPPATGDCYAVAARIVLHSADVDPFDGEYTLCHGTATGRGPIAGERFGHAWVEWNHRPSSISLVLDYSNGNKVVMHAALYYGLGGIDPSTVRRYSHDEMLHVLLTSQHYGPWVDAE